MGSVFHLWHTNSRLNPVVFGLGLVCSLQLLVSNCLLNCEVFSFANYFSHACHKQNLEAILCRSSSRLDPELRQQNGKSSWPFYGAQFLEQIGLKGWWLQRADSRDLVAGAWRAKGSCDARECRLWNSFEQLVDGFIVCAAQSRVAWQGAASPSPPQAWVSGYFVHELWISLSRSWLCGKRERWGANASHQIGAQQLQLQFGFVLCCLYIHWE